MITTMTVTELVRDTCHEAAARTSRGEEILVKIGRCPLFRIVPPRAHEEPADLEELEADLRSLARSVKDNPVIKLRARRK